MSDSSGAREDAVIAKYADRIAAFSEARDLDEVGHMACDYAPILREFLCELHGGERDTGAPVVDRG